MLLLRVALKSENGHLARIRHPTWPVCSAGLLPRCLPPEHPCDHGLGCVGMAARLGFHRAWLIRILQLPENAALHRSNGTLDDTTAAKSAHVEFRKRTTTLILTAICLALILAAAVWLAGRYVTGISVGDGEVVLQLSDEAGRQMLPDDPYLRDLASGPDALLHDAYLVVPWYWVALAVVVGIGSAAAVYVGVRWFTCKFMRAANGDSSRLEKRHD